MNTGKYDEITTMKVTRHNRERLEEFREKGESCNTAFGKLLTTAEEAKLRINDQNDK